MKILVNNFFSGILNRGIPLYTDNLVIALEKLGVDVRVVRAPKFVHNLPRGAINIFFVFYEQIIIPLLSFYFDLVINPYNSASLLIFPFKKQLIIIHDFIPNKRINNSIASYYIKFTQTFASIFKVDVGYVSITTANIGLKIRLFSDSSIFHLPNAFFAFEEIVPNVSVLRSNYVLLCSGTGKNKDFPGAINLLRASEVLRDYSIHILGFQGKCDLVRSLIIHDPDLSKRIIVLGDLNTSDVVAQYCGASLVWVHSSFEGYGRSIAEAKLCKRSILASNIRPFKEQQADCVFYYNDFTSFESNANAALNYKNLNLTPLTDNSLLIENLKIYLNEKYPRYNISVS